VVFVLSDTVGAEDVFHTTPRAVTAAPPSDVIFPPPAAPVAVILLIVVVLSVGIEMVTQGTPGQFSKAAFFQRTLISSRLNGDLRCFSKSPPSLIILFERTS
jgi:hypothetical protein